MRRRERGEGRTRVLIVEDHALVRRGLRELLSHEPDLEVCGEAAEMHAGFQLVEEQQPSVVIVDLTLPGGNGMDLIEQILSRFPETIVLVSSMHDEKLYAERVLRAGARGYINKHEPAERVIEAIRDVIAGGVYLSPRMSDRILRRLVKADPEADPSPLEKLSDRELQVLELIGRGLNSRDIGDHLHLSPKTVDTYRDRLKSKLNLRSASELLRFAVAWTLERGCASR